LKRVQANAAGVGRGVTPRRHGRLTATVRPARGSGPAHRELDELVRRALAEDLGAGDVTSRALVPAGLWGRARIIARSGCVVCGLEVTRRVFQMVDRRLRVRFLLRDGRRAAPGRTVAVVRGPVRGLLAGERTALNFLQRLSGIATLTAEYVRRVRPYRVAILDTRKTTPGLRWLEKYAVRCGGGCNHRLGLYDMVLIKDNHRRIWRGCAAGGLSAAIAAVRQRYPHLPVEIEVESEPELREALEGRPDWILLDNMKPRQLRRCVALCGGRCRLEASGGVTLRSVRRIAATGVQAISIGALTHSAPAADLSLELDAPLPRRRGCRARARRR